jgi:hypothetical protein
MALRRSQVQVALAPEVTAGKLVHAGPVNEDARAYCDLLD